MVCGWLVPEWEKQLIYIQFQNQDDKQENNNNVVST